MKVVTRSIFIIILLINAYTNLLAQPEKKLIEFGWNYPDVSQLKQNLPKMQQLPFNGVVFSLQRKIINIFDTIPLEDEYFQYETLSALPWKSFTDNFIYIWGMSNTGGHWLNDAAWNIITANTRKISKAVNLSKSKGILFDPEYYYGDPSKDPWKYKPEWYNGLTYQQLYPIIKQRGTQFIRALESDKPDIKFLSIWLFGLIAEQLKTKPLPETDQALLLPFIDGMMSGQGKTSLIIDGNETAYWYKTAEEFNQSGEILRKKSKELLPETPNVSQLSVAQCIYYDGIFDLLPVQWKKNTTRDYQEKWFRENLYNALSATDEYVWFYSENINWWKVMPDEIPLKLLDEAVKKYRSDSSK